MSRLKERNSFEDKKKASMEFFLSRGYAPEHAAGIVANLIHESGLNHTINTGDQGNAYGLAQWNIKGSPERYSNFEKIFNKSLHESTFEEQLEYIDWELNNTEKRAMAKLLETTNPMDAALMVSEFYERPYGARGRNIDQIREQYRKEAEKGIKAYHHNPEREQHATNLYLNYDDNIYAVDSNGDYVTLNPNFATEQDIQNSGVIKRQFYNEYLTNLQGVEENTNFEEVYDPNVFIGTEEQTPIQNIINNHYYNSEDTKEDTKEDKKVTTEVEEAKNILDERQFLVGLIQAGAFDLQNPEYKRVPTMQDGGPILPKRRNGVRVNPDGSVSTHLMVYGSTDNGYTAYPTLFQNSDNSWEQFDDEKAFEEAKRRGEIYNFETEKEARNFSQGNWKKLYDIRNNPTDERVHSQVVRDVTNIGNQFAYGGQIPTSYKGLYEYPNQTVKVPTIDGKITMKNIPYPVVGISQETGEQILMYPEQEYQFKNTKNVIEIPLSQYSTNKNMQEGGKIPYGTTVPILQADGSVVYENVRGQGYRDAYNQGDLMPVRINPENPEDIELYETQQLDEVILEYNKKPNNDGDIDTIRSNPNEYAKFIEYIKNLDQDSINLQKKVEKYKSNGANKEISLTEKDSTDIAPIGGNHIIDVGELPEIDFEGKDDDTSMKLEITPDILTYDQYLKLGTEAREEVDKKLFNSFMDEQKLDPKTKKDIIETQELLVDLGYNLGKYGKNKDGVDGIRGRMTNAAIKEYNESLKEIPKDNLFKNFEIERDVKDREEREDILNVRLIDKDTDILTYQSELQKRGLMKNRMEDFKTEGIKGGLDRITIEGGVGHAFKPYKSDQCEWGEQCSPHVTWETINAVGSSKFEQSNVRGDAWKMNYNITKAGGKTLFSIFDTKLPSLKSKKEIDNFIQSKKEKAKHIDEKELMPGDVVHIYNSRSITYAEEAYRDRKGDFPTTHVGIIKEGRDGKIIVEHNISGAIKRDSIEDLKNFKVQGGTMGLVGVSRPKFNLEGKGEIKYFDTKSIYEPDFNNLTNKDSPLLKENISVMQETIAQNHELLKEDLGLSDLEALQLGQGVLSIAWKESYGDGVKIDRGRNLKEKTKKTGAKILEKVVGRPMSKGHTQIKKDKNLNQELQKNLLRYVDDNDSLLNTFYNPAGASIASYYALATRYKYLQALSKTEGLKVSVDDLVKLSILGWNEDISTVAKSLVKYKDYEHTIKAYRTNKETGEEVGHDYDETLSVYENMYKIKDNKKDK